MYFGEDALDQLRTELIPDDCTSCTSSLATTVSINLVEEADELHLGAEANSFVGTARRDSIPPKIPEIAEKSGKCCNKGGYLIAMKELYNSFDSLNSHMTNSSVAVIETVSDLISAREVDPTEILAGLGFVNNSEERYRRDVLSRFDPSPLIMKEENKYVESKDFETLTVQRADLEESISKTQEWLSQHHENHSINNKTEQNKNSLTGTDTTKKPLSKAIRARRKFTKSRQSSFDLLPKLKEEDLNPDGENLNNSQEESKNWAATLNATIREKLEDRIENFLSPPTSLETSRLNDSEPTNRNSNFSLKLEREDTLTAISICDEADVNARICKPLSTRMESFELEEINSNNGETSDSSRPRVLTSSDTLTDENGCPPPTREEFPAKYSGDAVSDENESSSGFDEDETTNNVTQTRAIDYRRADTPHKVGDSLQVDLASCADLPAAIEHCICKSSTGNASSTERTATSNHNTNNNKVKHKDYTCTSCTNSADYLPSAYCVSCDSSCSTTVKSSSSITSTSDTQNVFRDLSNDSEMIRHTGSPKTCRSSLPFVKNELSSKLDHYSLGSVSNISSHTCICLDQHISDSQLNMVPPIKSNLETSSNSVGSTISDLFKRADETSQS